MISVGQTVISSFSGPQGNCYQMDRPEEDKFFLSDSKENDKGPEQPSIPFTYDGWTEILQGIQNGDLGIGLVGTMTNRPYVYEEAIVERTAPDEWTWRSTDEECKTILKFNLLEHDAFLMAVNDEEFTPAEEYGRIGVGDDTRADIGVSAPGVED